jgi:hypothetical protein
MGAMRKLKTLAVLAVAAEGLYAYGTVYAHASAPGGTTSAASASGPVTRNANEALANQMAASGYGWTGSQATCLDELWTEESGFSATALNSSSGATGIPQLLPSVHAIPPDWSSPAVQIKWGLSYIDDTYGSPCAAWEHEKSEDPNWY